MSNADFENILCNLCLQKKDFANLTLIPYQTLMNWKQKGETPKWVASWLTNYEKARFYEQIATKVLELESR